MQGKWTVYELVFFFLYEDMNIMGIVVRFGDQKQ